MRFLSTLLEFTKKLTKMKVTGYIVYLFYAAFKVANSMGKYFKNSNIFITVVFIDC